MKLRILLSCHNGSEYLPFLFASLRAQTFKDWALYVADDFSSVEERNRTRRLVAESGVPHVFFANPHNLGFACSSNFLFSQGESEYVQLLNQDAFLEPDYLERLVAYMDAHPECASASGRIMRWDFARRLETGGGKTGIIDSLGLRRSWIGEVYDIGSGESADSHPAVDGARPVFGVSGCLPMYRDAAVREASQDGSLFDGALEAYKEDVDLAYRLAALGYAAATLDGAVAYHRRTLQRRRAWFLRDTTWQQYNSFRNHSWNGFVHWAMPRLRLADLAIVPYEFSKLGYWLLRHARFLGRFVADTWRRRSHLLAKRRHVAALHRVGRSRPPREFSTPEYDVAVVIASYNRLDEECLTSLRRACLESPLRIAVMVVDNGSSAFHADEYVARHFPEAHCLLRGRNRGFGHSCNQGAREIEAKYYFFLNPDTRLDDPSVIDRLHAYASAHPEAGLVAPKLRYLDGRDQLTCRRFPPWHLPFIQRTFLGRTRLGRRAADRFLMADYDRVRTRPVDWVQGSAMFVSRDAFRLAGGFDERYFMYLEDADLCRKVRLSGQEVVYFPEATLLHGYAKESAKYSSLVRNVLTNRASQYHIASWLRYLLKWRFQRAPSSDRNRAVVQ